MGASESQRFKSRLLAFLCHKFPLIYCYSRQFSGKNNQRKKKRKKEKKPSFQCNFKPAQLSNTSIFKILGHGDINQLNVFVGKWFEFLFNNLRIKQKPQNNLVLNVKIVQCGNKILGYNCKIGKKLPGSYCFKTQFLQF